MRGKEERTVTRGERKETEGRINTSIRLAKHINKLS